jgi:predicted transcriptional regulator
MEGASKTRVVYQCNLNFHSVVPHLDSLIEKELIEVLPGGITRYKTTQKGAGVLEKLQDLQRILGENPDNKALS